MYKSYVDKSSKEAQSTLSLHSGEPDYQTATSLAALFDLGWYRLGLNADEKAQFKTLYEGVKVAKTVRDYYIVISKGRSLDDDIAKWINSAVVKNTQVIQSANQDKLSTWRTDNTGNVFATVKAADLITIKPGNSYFKFFKYIGTATTPDYSAISKNINNTFAKGGDQVIKFVKALYVGNHIFGQTVYYKNNAGTNISQQKVFAYVYGANGNYWGYVDLFEFNRVNPLSGFLGISQLMFS